MPVDSPEYIERQRGNNSGSSTLLWFIIVMFVIGGLIYFYDSRSPTTQNTDIVAQ